MCTYIIFHFYDYFYQMSTLLIVSTPRCKVAETNALIKRYFRRLFKTYRSLKYYTAAPRLHNLFIRRSCCRCWRSTSERINVVFAWILKFDRTILYIQSLNNISHVVRRNRDKRNAFNSDRIVQVHHCNMIIHLFYNIIQYNTVVIRIVPINVIRTSTIPVYILPIHSCIILYVHADEQRSTRRWFTIAGGSIIRERR